MRLCLDFVGRRERGVVMKRKKYTFLLAGFIMLCFLCSCSKNKPGSAHKVPSINCEYAFYNFAVSGEDGYYLLCGNLLGYWDGDLEHLASPLCKRPDCLHDTDECSARVPGGFDKLFYVDGFLYVFGSIGHQDPVTKSEVFPLWKFAADGSSREQVLFASELPQIYTVFQDKVYYGAYRENEEGKQVYSLFCQPLQGGKEVRLWESELQNGGVGMLQGAGEILYFDESGVDLSIDTSDPDYDFSEAEWQYNFWQYVPETGELRKNPEFNGKEGNKVVIRNVYQDKLYYSYGDNGKKELWCQSLEGEKTDTFLGDATGVTAVDSEFTYTHYLRKRGKDEGRLEIYDYERNLLQEFRFQNWEEDLVLLPGTEEYLFGYYQGQITDGGRKWDRAIVIVERSKLLEGKAELRRIFENEWS